MQQKEERLTLLCRSGYKLIQSGHHSSKLLHFLGIPRWLQVIDSFNLVWIYLNPLVGHHVPQKISLTHSKRTFRRIQTQLVLSQDFENACKIC